MKKSLIYLGISVFVFIFGQIYEYFSHGVYSSYMMYAFLIPFIGLFIPSLLNNLILKRTVSDNVTLPWKCGIATLSVGSTLLKKAKILSDTRYYIIYTIVL